MPFSHHVDAESGFGVIRLSGTISGGDLLSALAWFYDHEEWVPGARVLWDGRAIEDFVLTPEDLHAATEIVAHAVLRLGLDRTAVVAGELDSYMGGALFAARLGKRTGRDARVFTDFAPALEWLATPSPPLTAADILPAAPGAGDGSSLEVEAVTLGAVVAPDGVVAEEIGPEGAD